MSENNLTFCGLVIPDPESGDTCDVYTTVDGTVLFEDIDGDLHVFDPIAIRGVQLKDRRKYEENVRRLFVSGRAAGMIFAEGDTIYLISPDLRSIDKTDKTGEVIETYDVDVSLLDDEDAEKYSRRDDYA